MNLDPGPLPLAGWGHREVAAALRLGAGGALGEEAAVELLIAHDVWLHRSAFRRDTLDVVDADPRVLAVDWAAVLAHAGTSPASGSEIAVLRIAAGLAGHDSGCSLRDLLTGLDRTNAGHVVRAVAHTTGLEHDRTTTTPLQAPAALRPVIPGYGHGPASGPPAPGM